jgi:hypothetical protein
VRDVPFLFSTGYQPDRVRPEYQACPILQKPYRTAELERALRALFSHRGAAPAVDSSSGLAL